MSESQFDIFDDDLPFEEAYEAERQKALALRRMWTDLEEES